MKSRTFRRSTIALSTAAVVAMISISGYQTATAQQVAAKAELPPAELPVPRVGDKSVFRDKKGKDLTSEVTSVDSESISTQRSDGCSWTTVIGYGPTLEWSGCGGRGGTQTIKEREGHLFPLQVGNTKRWKFNGKNKRGYNWSGTRKCNVNGTAHVTVPAGTFDTYHIICTGNWTRREWHYSPELGTAVTLSRKPVGSSSTKPTYQELVSFTPGS